MDTSEPELTTSAPQHVPAPRYSLSTKASARAGWALTSLPPAILRLLGTRINSSGDELDGDVAASLRALEIIHGKDFADLPVGEGRAMIDEEAYLGAGKTMDVGSVVAQTIGGVPVRQYRPRGFESTDRVLPAVVYLHGGGWVLGSLDSHDSTCRWLCNRAGVSVISVDYRLAPEAPFPAGLEDAATVLRAAMTTEAVPGVDPQRVVIAGDSAGGNLSAAVCLKFKQEGLPQPLLQMLFVPATNLAEFSTDSHREFADGLFLTRKQMEWYRNHYVGSAEAAADPLVSPLLAEDVSGVAPAYVAVAGFDPLRDEGEAYAEKLEAAGVPVTCRRHRGLVHPFVNSTGVWRNARAALDDAVEAVKAAVAG
ncbi:lipase [Corynebacterium frankenforstense DSM 45800]|uniref:Lipase n=1 Tax=Corynebacterium frankenforstense DSM 45800 TaxID=1437875 RepID=A0A1L7CRI2_9CORY|nr:alpha/beta hydrolase [Corynebacterium frankenforstense]APT88446.1 lipase [Corynebacterium frankenforstense DSM 45800]